MTPGEYLLQCREGAGLSRDDVALGFDTSPPVSHRIRSELLADVEAGVVPVSLQVAAVLGALMHVNLVVLGELLDEQLITARQRQASGERLSLFISSRPRTDAAVA